MQTRLAGLITLIEGAPTNVYDRYLTSRPPPLHDRLASREIG